eukprot:scaffold47647_cov61-Phaeocystis_antarctica.AAC.3
MSSWRRRCPGPATTNTTATMPRATPRAVRDQMTRQLALCDDHGGDGPSHFRLSTPHTHLPGRSSALSIFERV